MNQERQKTFGAKEIKNRVSDMAPRVSDMAPRMSKVPKIRALDCQKY